MAFPRASITVVSPDTSIAVVNPRGPTVELETDGLQFNRDNHGGYLDVRTSGKDGDSNGIRMRSTADEGSILLECTNTNGDGITLKASQATVPGAVFQEGIAHVTGDDGGGVGDGADYIIDWNGGVISTARSFAIRNAFMAGNLLSIGRQGQVQIHCRYLAPYATAPYALSILNDLDQEIFRVNQDGSLQGKTGKALTFNL